MIKISIAGNCQASPLKLWLIGQFGAKTDTLIYHESTKDRFYEWLNNALSSELVFLQPLKEGYLGLKSYGSQSIKNYLERHSKAQVLYYPNFYCESLFPFYGYSRTSSGRRHSHELLRAKGFKNSYINFLALALSGYSYDLRCKFLAAFLLNKLPYIDNTINLLSSESIEQFNCKNPCFRGLINSINLCHGYTFDHPSIGFLNKSYALLLERIGIDSGPFRPLKQDFFGKLSLTLPIHPGVISIIDFKEEPLIHYRNISEEEYIIDLYNQMSLFSLHKEIAESNKHDLKYQKAASFIQSITLLSA